jgi:hypothetical protein
LSNKEVFQNPRSRPSYRRGLKNKRSNIGVEEYFEEDPTTAICPPSAGGVLEKILNPRLSHFQKPDSGTLGDDHTA